MVPSPNICEPYFLSTAGPLSHPKENNSTPPAVARASIELWNVPTMKRLGVSLHRAGRPKMELSLGGVMRCFQAIYLSGCMKHDTQWSASSSKNPARLLSK